MYERNETRMVLRFRKSPQAPTSMTISKYDAHPAQPSAETNERQLAEAEREASA